MGVVLDQKKLGNKLLSSFDGDKINSLLIIDLCIDVKSWEVKGLLELSITSLFYLNEKRPIFGLTDVCHVIAEVLMSN